MSEEDASMKLGGPIAGLKAQSTVTFEYCAREAAQIFGGLAYSRGGQGEKIERLYREVRAYSIPGGSEESKCDFFCFISINSNFYHNSHVRSHDSSGFARSSHHRRKIVSFCFVRYIRITYFICKK